jgi:hypothetical protein
VLLALREGVRLLPGRSIGLWTWATSFGSINVSTCCWEEVPVAGLLGTVLLVGFLWLCQNSSIDPASGVSLRCSSSDPLVLLRFPRLSIKVSTGCLEEVTGAGLYWLLGRSHWRYWVSCYSLGSCDSATPPVDPRFGG